MKKVCISVVVILCLLLPTYISYSSTLTDIVEKVTPSVVMIIVYDITGAEIGQGSGFFIDNEGRIITNAHVIKGAYSAEVFSELTHYDDVIIIGCDEDLDLALIQVKAVDESPLGFDFDFDMKPGERVIAIGNPLGLEKTVSDGLISAVRKQGETLEVIQTTVPISPGSSGGPLLNMAGKVIGVTTATITEGQNLNFAVSARSIKPFIFAVNLKPIKAERLHPPKSRVWFRWFLKWVGTVLIGLIALIFGGGYWLILIVVLAIMAVYWIFRGIFLFLSWPIRALKNKRSNFLNHQPLYNPEDIRIESVEQGHSEPKIQDSSTQKDDKSSLPTEPDFLFYCWKCGNQVRVDHGVKGQIAGCPHCGTELKIPDK